jgi:hypothetical protein
MYCVIQFYIQLRDDLKSYSPFLKVLAIKLVIFLSFWQSFLISILTSSTFNVVTPNSKVAYPDLKVGVPSLLLCIEMAIFAVLHLFAFSWKPYASGSKIQDYPMSPTSGPKNSVGPKQGGILGWRAIVDAMNPWDLVKGFARGMRWLFIGVKRRENDISYKVSGVNSPNDLDLQPTMSPEQGYKRSGSLPIADEFRRSKFGMPSANKVDDEGAGLIAHAQPNPLNNPNSRYAPTPQRYDGNEQDISSGGREYGSPNGSPDRLNGRNPEPIRRPEISVQGQNIGMAIGAPSEPYESHVIPTPYIQSGSDAYREQLRDERRARASPSEQWANSSQPTQPPGNAAHAALWGQPPAARSAQNEF